MRLAPVAALLWAGAAFAAPATDGASEELRRERIDARLFPVDEKLSDAQLADHARLALHDLGPLLEAHPRDAELHFLSGFAWVLIGQERGSERTPDDVIHRAIAELELSRSYAPAGARAEEIADSLGLLYSKLDQQERALVEYDRALALRSATALGATQSPGDARLLTNSAEALMSLGRLDEAITRYRRGLELATRGAQIDPRFGESVTLALYGLAVALDRDEQLERAGDAIRQAVARDPQLQALDDRNVFFVPVGDKHYYKALGQLERKSPGAAASELRAFLDELPASRYAPRARAHLAVLEREAHLAPGSEHHVTVGVIHAEPRDGEAIRRIVQRGERSLRACFAREYFLDPSDLDVVLELAPSGRVVAVAGVVGQVRVDAALLACLYDFTRKLRLGPGVGGPLTVPLHLQAGEAAPSLR